MGSPLLRNLLIRAALITAILLGVRGESGAEPWKKPAARRQALASLADSSGLPKVSNQAARALGRAFGIRLKPAQVRIVSYTEGRKFWNFVDQAKPCALGLAVTPHREGPHPHLLVGDHVYDGIEPGWQRPDGSLATFADGTMMRKETFGRPHGSPRIFLVYQAPEPAIAKVAEHAERFYTTRRQQGMNCAVFSTGQLAREGRKEPSSPFARLMPSIWPKKAVQQLMKTRPDLIVQVLPEADFQRAAADPNHLVKLWGEQPEHP